LKKNQEKKRIKKTKKNCNEKNRTKFSIKMK
jgi:hypothetical protein